MRGWSLPADTRWIAESPWTDSSIVAKKIQAAAESEHALPASRTTVERLFGYRVYTLFSDRTQWPHDRFVCSSYEIWLWSGKLCCNTVCSDFECFSVPLQLARRNWCEFNHHFCLVCLLKPWILLSNLGSVSFVKQSKVTLLRLYQKAWIEMSCILYSIYSIYSKINYVNP